MPAPSPWDAVRAREIIDAHRHLEGPALPILHALQEAFGHVPGEAVRMTAEALGVSRAEMHGIVTFYQDFRETPAGRVVIKVCRAESCQARGGRAIGDRIAELLGLKWYETSTDGRVTLEPVYCLGLCASGPSAMVDGIPFARLDKVGAERLVEEIAG